ncbi:AAA family ATPase [Gammaproteobacteria bacterium AB-CW1]|uniref:AAA family ATPase n=1 Tax=Natronospira elongata TaxID=3110268 RepID=A0AAP6JE38_9GAMM|nr:AAA family ATPase [Gammaproteobacteria bacterium AB-CW1]
MRRIVVINPKGGCGKTTIATNLASYYAVAGHRTSIMDYDVQGSSWQWLQLRGPDRPHIEGVRAAEAVPGATRVWQTRPPEGTERLIVDTPAALDYHRLVEATRGAQAIIIPVLPSNIDIHAASRCIADLLIKARISRRGDRLAVVANRARRHTRVYAKLERFLNSLEIPFITTLRDTQNYVRAVEHGVGIFELPESETRKDRNQWKPLIDWIESRPVHQLIHTRDLKAKT